MKVRNMTSSSGREVPNQFVITDGNPAIDRVFQSYDKIIVKQRWEAGQWHTELSEDYWDYSVTTGKYRNQFLGETKKETQAKIDSGEYILTDLNS
jgi:hypothetical protein